MQIQQLLVGRFGKGLHAKGKTVEDNHGRFLVIRVNRVTVKRGNQARHCHGCLTLPLSLYHTR